MLNHHWRAMGTRFGVSLCGDDPEHLSAVAHAIEAEVVRLDELFSRFNPTSEISRVNREAQDHSVRVSREVWDLLELSDRYRRSTQGAFSVTAQAGHDSDGHLTLDAEARTVRLHGSRIDLGAIAKGFAIDAAWDILRQQRVTIALLNGGGSSMAAIGCLPTSSQKVESETGWPIDVRLPGSDSLTRINLTDRAFSYSGARDPGQAVSDVLDPNTGLPLDANAACVVLAPTATQAEALSTALLVLGRDQAADYIKKGLAPDVSFCWLPDGLAAPLEWITGSRSD